jgi:hypothetical protein
LPKVGFRGAYDAHKSSISCFPSRGAHATGIPCHPLLEEACVITDGVQQDGMRDQFQRVDWTEFYPEAKEAIPQDDPEPRGVSVEVL